MDMNLSKLQEMVKDKEARRAASTGLQRVGQDLATEQQQPIGPSQEEEGVFLYRVCFSYGLG